MASTAFNNLVGNAGNDTFSFSSGSSVRSVDGVAGGINKLDYSNYGSAANVNLQTALASGITFGFSNITQVTGDTTNNGILTGLDGANTWTITGANSGTVTGLSNGFTNMDTLVGGTLADSFTISGGNRQH